MLIIFLVRSLRELRAPLSKNEAEADFQSIEKYFGFFFFRLGKQLYHSIFILLY